LGRRKGRSKGRREDGRETRTGHSPEATRRRGTGVVGVDFSQGRRDGTPLWGPRRSNPKNCHKDTAISSPAPPGTTRQGTLPRDRAAGLGRRDVVTLSRGRCQRHLFRGTSSKVFSQGPWSHRDLVVGFLENRAIKISSPRQRDSIGFRETTKDGRSTRRTVRGPFARTGLSLKNERRRERVAVSQGPLYGSLGPGTVTLPPRQRDLATGTSSRRPYPSTSSQRCCHGTEPRGPWQRKCCRRGLRRGAMS